MTNKQFPINTDEIKDNIYDAVNGAWTKQATIPADHSSVGGFMDLVDDIEKTLMKDSEELKNGTLEANTPELKEYVKFYKMANNFKKRDSEGAASVKPIIERIINLKDFNDLNDQLPDWILSGLPTPFSLDLDPDMKNAKVNALFASGPSLFMPDKTYYEKGNQAFQQLMPIFTEMSSKLLQMVGYNENDANKIVVNAKKFDQLIAPNVKSAEEAADYSKMYNPETTDELASSTSVLNLKAAINQLVGAVPDKIIVTEPQYFQHLAELLSANNFQLMKDWMLVKVVNRFSGTLSEDFRQVGDTYSRALSGKEEAMKPEKAAFYLASGTFDQVVGDYYGKKYFGEKAKADVHHMVEKMIGVYKDRLSQNEWLSPDTKKMAIKKLSTLGIQVGYPEKITPIYSKFKTNENESILANLLNFSKIANQDMFSKWNKPVERERWEMSANTVNAYYHPFKNIIVFPAAILQAPFYSLNQSSSANYGGIGAVIAHEISHAFDNNGSLFDEFGNLNNWWSKEDHQHFTELAQKMIKEFDGIPFAGGKVNGKLTVSENIADAGGLSCAEAAAKQEPDADLNEFFINWTRIWRMKARMEYQQLLLSIDVHAPAALRASVQVKNLDDFYSTFDVTDTDKMYLDPADRVQIW
ncbi:peptidase M13 [Fructilactobacillus lindneri]|uniref:Neutral endopeptidase n=2 Tax=Fructilactobacillus lindneri TaxID=53444 RepID=A0A0R2JTN0_9LACO|nr:M13-type metalloendopeptidase [Fructilactobacillus lindneri]ANZ57822.1 peptidase M13 [Fructilactobacillus lindneri]ANZ59091.1 peptidase M13 [Fructilactobacillus lindneri]KRN78725.1 Neutral endopeptidase [Fructilactobacillus lindneri DSM 20690 = JCM 11027]POG98145.1 peptidase M13 [Fructilactobacillus lindneri]POH01739.1 peptidase M13 [Fructilactobacillus lindneri]